MKTRTRRFGFTLPEVLVTVTVVAVLAAVVVPAVVQQVGKGDQGQLSSDLKAAQTAVNNFATDVRLFPAHFKQLQTAIATTDSSVDATSSTRPYSSSEITRWNGPYGRSDVDSIVTGYGFVIGGKGAGKGDTINVVSNEILVSAHGPKVSAPGASFTVAQIAHIDSLVDGASGASAGMIRWTALGTTPDSAKNIKVVVGSIH